MSTPSTATAVHPSYQFYPRYADYQPSSSSAYHSSNPTSRTQLTKLSYNNTSSTSQHNSSESQAKTQSQSKQQTQQDVALNDSPKTTGVMASSRRRDRKADWNDFYKNGVPKEVIVIDDDSPEPQMTSKRPHNSPTSTQRQAVAGSSTQSTNKRRKIDASGSSYDPVHNHSSKQSTKRTPLAEDSISNGTNSSGRTTSALVSTAPTSLTSTSSATSQRTQKNNDSKTGQKRKRGRRTPSSESRESDEDFSQTEAFPIYVPPPKPPIKAPDVYVTPVRDKITTNQKVDDEDGHYIVVANTDLTERYKITKLLGQGTFGKVVEAYDKKKGSNCAVKIIRAVPKYRDASRIELRVLSTLAHNDKYNRNKCIHLRDCFDFRNHICIVTDLLSQSVFDFLKGNAFTPFPSTHIQSFARQLFTSVAFLHDLNLIHTDLKPENILLVNSNYQTFTYNRIIPSSSKSTQRHAKYRKVLLNPEIRLIDFGSATFDDEYHSSVVSTRHYRAPEIILNIGWSYPCDIWSIGCILVEFFTGDALFQTHDNLEHLAMMEPVCGGKIEGELIDKVRQGNRGGNRNSAATYFKQKAYSLDYPNSDTPRTSKKYVKNMKKLSETIPATNQFNTQFLDLLRRIFVYDPRKRITARQALQHPWFKETLKDDGTEALKIRLQKERNAVAKVSTQR